MPIQKNLAAALCLLCVFAGRVFAGDLNPPAGPITPTQRTPISDATTPGDADSRFRIAAPGSYYLTGNALGVAAKAGIEIASDNVSIDLMGFELKGVNGSLNGVVTDTPRTNVLVRNGTVSNWGSSGVDLAFAGCIGSVIEEVAASANDAFGIRCGTHGIIRDCHATSNADIGIIGFSGALVQGCAARSNGSTGIACGDGATVIACSARFNNGSGISTTTAGRIADCNAYLNGQSGFSIGSGSTISGCTVANSTTDGIVAGNGCLVMNNSCRNNGSGGTGAGILVSGTDNRIEGNNCIAADTGISVVGTGNFIARNTCSGNTTNWNIAGINNICLVVNATAAAPFSGNSGGVAPGSTDPNANFTY